MIGVDKELNTLRIGLIVLPCVFLMASACATPGFFGGGENESNDEAATLAAQAAAERGTLRDVSAGFVNPSFEDINPDGTPVGWIPVGDLGVRSGEAADGTHFAHVGGVRPGGGQKSFYFQQFNLDVPPWQSISVRAYNRGTLGVEIPDLDLEAGGYSFLQRRPEPVGTDEWVPVVGTATRTSTETQALVVRLYSRFPIAWIGYDNIEFIEEDFAGEFSPGSSKFSATVAHSPLAPEYFLTGEYSGGGTVSELRFDAAGTFLEDESTTMSLAPGDTSFVLSLPRSQNATHAISNVTLEGAASSFSRGFAYAFPEVFQPVANSMAPTTRLAAAWPGELASAEIFILDSNGFFRHLISDPFLDGSSAWWDFDGAGLPAGEYTAVFSLTSDAGRTIELDRTFRIERPPAYGEDSTPLEFDEFTKMAWLFHFRLPAETTADEAEALLLQASDAGFNKFLLIIRPDLVDAFKVAADRVGVPYQVALAPVWDSMRLPQAPGLWSPQVPLAEIEALRPMLESPLFEGVYIYDEPFGFIIDRVHDMAAFLENETPWPPAHSILASIRGPEVVRQISTPVIQEDAYPFGRNLRDLAADLQMYISDVEVDIVEAHELGREFWGVIQGFNRFPEALIPSEASLNAYLGLQLALGVDGYHVFTFSQIDTIAGLTDVDGEPTAYLPAYTDFNQRIDGLAGALELIGNRRGTIPQTDVIARTAWDDSASSYTFLINSFEFQNSNITVTTDSPGQMMNVETGEETAPGTSHAVTLPPGGWGLFRFTPGATPTEAVGVPDAAPELPELPISVVGSFSLIPDGNSPEPDQLMFNEAGTRLAITDQTFARVYSVEPQSFGGELFREAIYPYALSGFARFVDDTTLAIGEEDLGLRIYEENDFVYSLDREFTRETGGATDYLPIGGGKALLGRAYFGVSLIEEEGGEGFSLGDHSFGGGWSFYSLHGPYADGSVLGVSEFDGVWRFHPEQEELGTENLTGPANFTRGAESPSRRRMAIPSQIQGLAVYEVSENGDLSKELQLKGEPLRNAESAAWITEDILAVTDPMVGVHFYILPGNGLSVFLGTFVPGERPFIVNGVAAGPGLTAAVSLKSNEVLILDLSSLAQLQRPTGWMITESGAE